MKIKDTTSEQVLYMVGLALMNAGSSIPLN